MLRLAYAPAWIAASGLLVAGVLFASLVPQTTPPTVPSHFDKLGHAVAYLCLTLWFTGLVPRSRYGGVVLALASFGLVIELLQEFMPFGRQGDPLDMAANLAGIGMGIAIATWTTGGWAPRIEAWLRRA